MSDQAGEKKFELSDKRRGALREQGSVARSHDVSTAVILGVGLVLFLTGGATAITGADVLTEDRLFAIPEGETGDHLSVITLSATQAR